MFGMSLVLILLRNSNETGDVTIKSNIQNKTEKKERKKEGENTFTVRKRNNTFWYTRAKTNFRLRAFGANLLLNS